MPACDMRACQGEVQRALTHADLFVAFGTRNYGVETACSGCTYHEVRMWQELPNKLLG